MQILVTNTVTMDNAVMAVQMVSLESYVMIHVPKTVSQTVISSLEYVHLAVKKVTGDLHVITNVLITVESVCWKMEHAMENVQVDSMALTVVNIVLDV